jgi:3-hydroxyacyl-[acyl-carrier-protein] dehydratase
VPGAILMEALAEVGAVAALGLPENRGKIAVLTGADRWRFRKIVLPGNPIHLEAVLSQFRRNIGIGQARAYAPGEARAYAEGQLSFAIVDRPSELATDFPVEPSPNDP